MMNPQWNPYQMVQNPMMPQMNPYLPQQPMYQLNPQYNPYGFGQSMSSSIPPVMSISTMPSVQPMSSSMPSIQPVSSLQPVTPSSQPITINPQSTSNNQQTENKIKELLPRTPTSPTIDMGSGQNILNITLNASTGNKTVINASAETTIKSLLKMYTLKLGLNPDVIGKEIMFLYNGAQLDFKSQSPIGSLFRSSAVITVYDLGGIIGACKLKIKKY